MKSCTSTHTSIEPGRIKTILYLLQNYLGDFQAEVDRSYALLNVGATTELVQKIETLLTNPIDNITNMANNIDTQVKHLADVLVKSFLHEHKVLVNMAYRSKTPFNDLHYCIVLHTDDMVNRSKIFNFYDMYDLLEIAERYPVYFQFVPTELADKIIYSEQLKLA
jgi:hypothetical protein